MCLHKHATIVHQHLYNIKGVIYKSTGIVQGAVLARTPRPPSSSLRFLQPGKEPGGEGRGTVCDKAGGIHLWACHLRGSRSVRTPQRQSSLESGAKNPRYDSVRVLLAS